MSNFVERTIIAEKLGISRKTLDRIAYYGKIEFKIVDGKRYLDFDNVVETIRKGKE